ncbi:HAD hydrolase family protein [Candidatus Woesearchaeota archaeon]|nr:HAD hydrolase family protein [Candidatus Woesearchaeota archaeon]
MQEKFRKIRMLVMDFDGVLTNNLVLVDSEGGESVFCSRADGFGIDMLKKSGKELLVLSKEENKVVEARCKKLKIPCIHGIEDKEHIFMDEIKKKGIGMEEVCFIGNDLNDIGCIKLAGIGVAVQDAYPLVKKCADYITDEKGGCGAVREVADLILSGFKV